MSCRWTRILAGFLLLGLATGCAELVSPQTPPPATAPPTGTAVPAAASSEAPEPTATDVPPSPTPQRPLAALVNGEPIYLSDYQQELDRFKNSLEDQGIDPNSQEGQNKVAQAKSWILNMMIEQQLTEQAAQRAGIEVTEGRVEQYMRDMVAESGGEEAFEAKLAEWGETYEQAKEEVRAQLIGMQMTQRIVDEVPASADHVCAQHILLDTEEEARRILSQLEAGADFAELAQAHSKDEWTRASDGDLGCFPRGTLPFPALEEAAFSLQPGQISDVVQTSLGYHVVKVVRREPNQRLSAEDVQLLREKAVQDWVDSLWAQADVERFVGEDE